MAGAWDLSLSIPFPSQPGHLHTRTHTHQHTHTHTHITTHTPTPPPPPPHTQTHRTTDTSGRRRLRTAYTHCDTATGTTPERDFFVTLLWLQVWVDLLHLILITTDTQTGSHQYRLP